MRGIHISWDGPAQRYHESLFLPIIAQLKPSLQVDLLQFGWADSDRADRLRRLSASAGVRYDSVQVQQRPRAAGPLFSIANGAQRITKLSAARSAGFLMPRSTIPAAMAIAALRRQSHLRLVYDADGLMADERVEFQGWNARGLPYRTLRHIEKVAVQRADAVITRSHSASEILALRAGLDETDKFFPVSNGRDPEAFKPSTINERNTIRQSLGISETSPLLIHVGSIAERKYHLSRIMRFASLVRDRIPDVRLLMLTAAEAAATEAAIAEGLPEQSIVVRSVNAFEVPRFIGAADLGLSFVDQSFAMQAVSPIKIAEYLLCGVPVLATRSVGEVASQVPPAAGMLLDSLDSGSLGEAATWFASHVLPDRESFREGARDAGLASFRIESTVDQYRSAILSAMEGAPAGE